MVDTPELRRALFGYSKRRVDAALSERDIRLVESLQRARESEDEVVKLRADVEELSSGRSEAERSVADLVTTTASLRSELAQAREDARVLQESSRERSGTEGIWRVLDATRLGVAELLEDARLTAERDLHESERTLDGLRGEIDQLTSWRDRVTPLADELRGAIEAARQYFGALDDQLARLSETAPPPRTAGADVIRLEDPSPVAGRPEATRPWGEAGSGA